MDFRTLRAGTNSMADLIGMRPSERRREGRRAWWTFGLLCLGSILGVLAIGEVAGLLVDPRFQPTVEKAEEAIVPIVRRFPPATARHTGQFTLDTSRAVQEVLTAERQVEIAGAVLFLKGAIELGHTQVSTEDGDRLVVTEFVPVGVADVPDTEEDGEGNLQVKVFTRDGDTWKFLSNVYDKPVLSTAEGFATRDQVIVEEAGTGVVVVHLPESGQCLPITESDLATRRSLYIAPDEEPTLLLEHVSAGVRGFDETDRASIRLTWDGRKGREGRGHIAIEHDVAGVVESWEVKFEHSGKRFTLARLPDSILVEEERVAAAAAGEGRPDAAERFERLADAIELIVPIEGRPSFCIGMPHRVSAHQNLDRRAWQDAVSDRLFRIRLSRADLLATEGKGRAAIAMLAVQDVSLVLTSSTAGRRILERIRGPRVINDSLVANVDLRKRPTWATTTRVRARYPILWADNQTLLVPEPDPDDLGWFVAAQASALSGALINGERIIVVEPRLLALSTGALRSTLPPRWADLQARDIGPTIRVEALDVALELAIRENQFIARQFRQLDVNSRTWSLAPWPLLQRYAPFQKELDLTPSRSRLLVDVGVTCGGGFVQFCLGRAEVAYGTASGFADACVVGGSSIVIPPGIAATDGILSSPLKLPIDERDCYPGELRAPLERGIEVLGWQADERLLLYHEGRYIAAEIGLTGVVEATIVPARQAITAADEYSWAWPRSGPDRRYTVLVDDAGIWLLDHVDGRELLVQWWSELPFGPARADWQGALSPDGTHIAVWLEGEGLWVADLAKLR